MDVLARIACTPVPDGRRGEVIDELVTAIRSGPAERLVRLAQNYLGTRPDRVDPVDALLRLRAKLTEAGPDGMNARELVEGIRGDRVQTNLVSSRRRLKIWRNRLAEVEPAPATPQGQP